MTDAVLFDLDGTLSDPTSGIVEGTTLALAELGRDRLNDEQLRAFVGPPLPDSFAALGLEPDEVDRAVATYRAYYGHEGLFRNVLYPGVAEMLGRLGAQGFVLAVATSKPEPFAVRIVEHFGLDAHFTVVAGTGLDGSRHHKREVVEACLDVLAPTRAVMVGDRRHDVAAATHHGLACLGVTWGFGSSAELIDAGAVDLVARPDQVADAVARLLPG